MCAAILSGFCIRHPVYEREDARGIRRRLVLGALWLQLWRLPAQIEFHSDTLQMQTNQTTMITLPTLAYVRTIFTRIAAAAVRASSWSGADGIFLLVVKCGSWTRQLPFRALCTYR